MTRQGSTQPKAGSLATRRYWQHVEGRGSRPDRAARGDEIGPRRGRKDRRRRRWEERARAVAVAATASRRHYVEREEVETMSAKSLWQKQEVETLIDRGMTGGVDLEREAERALVVGREGTWAEV